MDIVVSLLALLLLSFRGAPVKHGGVQGDRQRSADGKQEIHQTHFGSSPGGFKTHHKSDLQGI